MMLEYAIKHGIPGWIRPDGSFMPIISGAQDDAGDGDNDDANDGDDGDDDADDQDQDGQGEGGDGIKDPQARIKALEDQLARRVRKEKRKDRTIQDLQKQIDELKKTGQTDDDKKREADQQREKEYESLRAEHERLKKERLILEHDDVVALPKRRRKLVTKMVLDDLEIDEDGDSNLDELIAEAKKEDPDLFVSAKQGEQDDGKGDGNGQTQSSGRNIGSKKKKDKNSVDDAAIRDKFPALRGRVPAKR